MDKQTFSHPHAEWALAQVNEEPEINPCTGCGWCADCLLWCSWHETMTGIRCVDFVTIEEMVLVIAEG